MIRWSTEDFQCCGTSLWYCNDGFVSLCCYSVSKSCLTICNPMNCSPADFPVLHYHPEFAQTHVHWVCDAIQPSRLLSLPSPPALYLSQCQGLFQLVGSLHQVTSALASVLPMNIQGWFPLGMTGLISLLSKELLTVFCSIIILKHQFFGAQPSLWSNSHIVIIHLSKPIECPNHGLWVIMMCPCRLFSFTNIPLWRGRSVVEETVCWGRRGWQEAYGNSELLVQSKRKIKL